ncbi:hypothetical protein PR048_026789 [Dryococelus australis]|uniref:Uncharacterized protein n=1 Tax=Dryococelus australis TaxID=614101 RepID=A0ABQ9GMD6_9NEOP|nr:hypothetical protein PR048_026789 [Dryococelus australis]
MHDVMKSLDSPRVCIFFRRSAHWTHVLGKVRPSAAVDAKVLATYRLYAVYSTTLRTINIATSLDTLFMRRSEKLGNNYKTPKRSEITKPHFPRTKPEAVWSFQELLDNEHAKILITTDCSPLAAYFRHSSLSELTGRYSSTRDIPEKTRRPTASFGTIKTCEKSGGRGGGNPGKTKPVRLAAKHFHEAIREYWGCAISKNRTTNHRAASPRDNIRPSSTPLRPTLSGVPSITTPGGGGEVGDDTSAIPGASVPEQIFCLTERGGWVLRQADLSTARTDCVAYCTMFIIDDNLVLYSPHMHVNRYRFPIVFQNDQTKLTSVYKMKRIIWKHEAALIPEFFRYPPYVTGIRFRQRTLEFCDIRHELKGRERVVTREVFASKIPAATIDSPFLNAERAWEIRYSTTSLAYITLIRMDMLDQQTLQSETDFHRVSTPAVFSWNVEVKMDEERVMFRTINSQMPCSPARLPPRQTEFNTWPGHSGIFASIGIVVDDDAGRQVFSAISRFPRPCVPALLHTLIPSRSSALQTLFRATPISQLIFASSQSTKELGERGQVIHYLRGKSIRRRQLRHRGNPLGARIACEGGTNPRDTAARLARGRRPGAARRGAARRRYAGSEAPRASMMDGGIRTKSSRPYTRRRRVRLRSTRLGNDTFLSLGRTPTLYNTLQKQHYTDTITTQSQTSNTRRTPHKTTTTTVSPSVSGDDGGRDRGSVVVRLLASHLGEPGLILGGVTHGFSDVGIVPDDAGGFSRKSPVSPALAFQRCSVLASFHYHRLSRPRCKEPPRSLHFTQESRKLH